MGRRKRDGTKTRLQANGTIPRFLVLRYAALAALLFHNPLMRPEIKGDMHFLCRFTELLQSEAGSSTPGLAVGLGTLLGAVEPGRLLGGVDTCRSGEVAGRHTSAGVVERRKPGEAVGSILREVVGRRIE